MNESFIHSYFCTVKTGYRPALHAEHSKSVRERKVERGAVDYHLNIFPPAASTSFTSPLCFLLPRPPPYSSTSSFLHLKVIDSLKLWTNNKIDTAWPGAYYSQVMDSAALLNDIARRLDDKGWRDLWAGQEALVTPFLPSHTHTLCLGLDK